MNPTLRVAAAIAVLLITTITADAKLICGLVQMAHYGIHDRSFALARHWLVFPRTTPHPGAVVVFSRGHDGRSGHVARIVSVHDRCSATVTDEKGTYERDICRRQLGVVDPNGNRSYAYETNYSSRRYSSRHHHHRRYDRITVATFQPEDRLNVH